MELNKYSKRVTQDDSQPAAKAMLHAIGLTKEDFNSFERYEYISRTSLGEKTAGIYINEALKLIDSSPKPNKNK